MTDTPTMPQNTATSRAFARLMEGHASAKELLSPPKLLSRSVLAGTARALEMALLVGIGALIWVLYVAEFTAASTLRFLLITSPVVIFIFVAMQFSGLFNMSAYLKLPGTVARLAAIWSLAFGTVLIVVFFTKAGDSLSRVWLGSWATSSMSLIIIFRLFAARLFASMNKKGQLSRRAVLVGGGERAEQLMHAYETSPDRDVKIIGIFDDRADDRSPETVAGLKKLGPTAELVDFARQTRVDMLIVTLPIVAETRLLEVLKPLWVLPTDIRLSAYAQKLRYKARTYSYVGKVPMLDLADRPITGWNAILKNIEDKVLATLALILLSPLMALTALAIKLDSRGPVLFKQKRYGFNNELIEVYKFRSMYTDQCDATASKLVTRGDPRVTRVGRFIRRTSIDELPQIFNVLKGQLSLVGPRPHATQAKAADRLYDDVVDGYFARHRVKPGITGWAQINGWRGETDTREKIERRVEHDLYYIENWSLLLDIYILARTPLSLIETDQAF